MHGKCPTCGSIDNTEVKTKAYTCSDMSLGDVQVPDIEHEVCVNCGEAMSISFLQAKCVEAYVAAMKSEFIGKLPVCDFISKSHALEFACVDDTAVAVGNFDRFTHNIKVAGRWMYYRPSVEAFLSTGDGRIPLR